MLWAYFDESGKLANSDYICLCGYICDEGWENFSTDWGKLLKRNNLPLIHASKIFRKAPPFDTLNWTDPQRDAILSEFVKPVRDHLLVGFGVGLNAKYYRSMPPDARKLIGENDAQDYAFYRLMRLIIDQLKSWNHAQPISVNFDYTEDFSVKCIQSLAKLRSGRAEVRALISSIGFADDQVYYPLQAADFLAYGTYGKMRSAAPAYFTQLVDLATNSNPGPAYKSEFYDIKELDDLYIKLKGETP